MDITASGNGSHSDPGRRPPQNHYVGEIVRAMELFASDPNTVFLGQSICYPGNSIYNTLKTIPAEQKIEMPVTEDMQMGMSLGLALAGKTVVTTYPRFDFLVLASNQLINHLDKINELTEGMVSPKVIIRTIVGTKTPLDAGPQHTQDHTLAFRDFCSSIEIHELHSAKTVFPLYQNLFQRKGTCIALCIEYGDLYV